MRNQFVLAISFLIFAFSNFIFCGGSTENSDSDDSQQNGDQAENLDSEGDIFSNENESVENQTIIISPINDEPNQHGAKAELIINDRNEWEVGDTEQFTIQLQIPEGYHAFVAGGDSGFGLPIKVCLNSNAFNLENVVFPDGKEHTESDGRQSMLIEGEQFIYGMLEFFDASLISSEIELSIEIQLCKEESCFRPYTFQFEIPTNNPANNTSNLEITPQCDPS